MLRFLEKLYVDLDESVIIILCILYNMIIYHYLISHVGTVNKHFIIQHS